MGKNIQQKNTDYLLRDTQKQLAQLKAKIATLSKAKGSEYVIRGNGISRQFKKYDIAYVDPNGTVVEYSGSETYEDEIIPAIVIGGNYGDASDDVFLLINGISYVKVTEDVSPGAILYPSSNDYRACDSSSGGAGYYKALEAGDANSYIRVMLIHGVGGSSSSVYFRVLDASDYTDPENPVFQVTREGGPIRVNNSVQNVEENITLQDLVAIDPDGPWYWHLKWEYTVTFPSVIDFETPTDVIDTETEHSETLPEPLSPLGTVWLTIAKIEKTTRTVVIDEVETEVEVLLITNYITEVYNLIIYNSCSDGIRTE